MERTAQVNSATPPRTVVYGKYGGPLRGIFVQKFGPAHLDGLKIGRSGAVVLRLLHLFTIDYEEMPWFRRGDPPPSVRLPGHIKLRWLTKEEWQKAPDILDRDAKTIADRFDAGARCLMAWDENTNRVIYHVWVSETGAYVDWIFRYVDAPANHLMVFDAWVHPGHRGGKLHWAGAAEVFAEAVRCGERRIFAGMEEMEYFPFVEKIARLGLGTSMPHSKIIGLKVYSKSWHVTGGPSPLLAEFGARLRAQNLKRISLKHDMESPAA